MNTDELKKLFKDEINKIHNYEMKQSCLEMMYFIPDYFWKVPASSSGKYHPKCDLGEGGLVRHSLMVTKVGLDLLRAEIFVRDTKTNEDIVRIACIFHDVIKQGDNEGHTVFEHPILAAKFLEEHLQIDSVAKDIIIDAVLSHMGKWNKKDDIELNRPMTDFEKLVHTADYIASRKYISWSI